MPPFNFSATPELRVAVALYLTDPTAAENQYGPINEWNFLSSITDMSELFRGAASFNADISNWDTSNVTNMADMFNGATQFNQDISGWNTSKVTNMSYMFKNAQAFAEFKIRSWDVSQVTTFKEMFDGDIPFQNHFGIGDTPVKDFFGKMTNEKLETAITEYFQNKATAIAKYGYIYLYDTSEVTIMRSLFRDQATFTGVYNITIDGIVVNVEDITTWVTSKVTDMSDMFNGATQFNLNIGGWDTSKVTIMNYMFNNAELFNADISGWNTDSLLLMRNMFDGALAFNQELGNWNVSNVKVMKELFKGAVAFDKEVRSWTLNADSVVDADCYTGMFTGATAFHTAFGTNDTTERDFFTQTNAELKSAVVEFNSRDDDTGVLTETIYADITSKTDFGGVTSTITTYPNSTTSLNIVKPTGVDRFNSGCTLITGNFLPIENASSKVISLRVNTTTSGQFMLRLENSEGSSAEDLLTQLHTGSGWETLTFLLDKFPNGSAPWSSYTRIVIKPWINRDDSADTQNATCDVEISREKFIIDYDANEAAAQAKYGLFSNLYVKDPDMSSIFANLPEFNRSILAWNNLDQVTTIESLFENAIAYNKAIPVPMLSVTNVTKAFKGAIVFNQPVDFTNYGAITDLTSVFEGATAFSQIVSYDASNITSLYRSFMGTSITDITLSSPNTDPTLAVLTDLESTFEGCSLLTTFNIEVLLLTKVTTAKNLFKNCSLLNNNVTLISDELTTVESILEGCASFNSNIVLNSPKLVDVTNALTGAFIMSGDITCNAPLLAQDLGKNDPSDTFKISRVYNGVVQYLGDLDNMTNYNCIWTTDITKAFNVSLSDTARGDGKKIMKVDTPYNDNGTMRPYIRYFQGIYILDPWAGADYNNPNGNVWAYTQLDLYTSDANDSLISIDDGTVFPSGLGHIVPNNDAPGITNRIDILNSCRPVYNGKFILYADILPSVEALFKDCIVLNKAPELYVPAATSAKELLHGCVSFNQPLTLDLVGALTMESMLERCISFNNTLTLIHIDKVTNANKMLKACAAFDQPLTLELPEATTVESALEDCATFNSSFVVNGPKVTNASKLLKGALLFNQPVTDTMLNIPLVENLESTFQACEALNEDIVLDNTSNTTNMKAMFAACTSLNKTIDVDSTNVTTLESFLEDALVFDNSIRRIDTTHNVVTMKHMFKNCLEFNQNIEALETTNLEIMEGMLEGCAKYNQNLESLLAPGNKVTNMKSLLKGCVKYNQCIEDLQTENVTTMESMFEGCVEFNQCLCDLNTNKVTNFSKFLMGCIEFDQELDHFDTSSARDLSYFLSGATSFNREVGINASNVTDMSYMFSGALALDAPINVVSTANVTNMEAMFVGASVFNQPLTGFDTINVTNMKGVFDSARAFNQPLDGFTTPNVTNMSYMFHDASSFNQPLDGFTTPNVTNMRSMFHDASSFNQPLTGFTTPNVTDMLEMFNGASSFNQPLDGFDTSNITDMSKMFHGASSFNQPLGHFDTSNVTTMESFLEEASSFNESLPDLIGTQSVDNKPIVNASDWLNGYSTVNKMHIGYMAADFRYFGYWPNGEQWYQYGTAFTGSYYDALDYANTATPITNDGYFVLGIFFRGSAALLANEVKKQMQELMAENTELSVLDPNTNSISNSISNNSDNTSLNDTIASIAENEEEGIVKIKKLEYLSLMIKYNNLMEKSKTERTYNIAFDTIEYVEVVELNDTIPITPYLDYPPGDPMKAILISADTYQYFGTRSGAHFWNADTFVFPTPALLDRIIKSTKEVHIDHLSSGVTPYFNWTFGDIEDIYTTIKYTNGMTYGSIRNMKNLLKNASLYSGNIGKINPVAANDLEGVFEGTSVVDIPFTYIDDENYSITSLKNTFKNATNFNGDIRTIPINTFSCDLTDTITGTAVQNRLGVPLPGFNIYEYLDHEENTVTFSDGSGFDAVTPSEADGWTFIDYYYYYAPANNDRNHIITFPTGKRIRLNGVTYTSGFMNGGRLRLYQAGESVNNQQNGGYDYRETIEEFYQQSQIAWSWDLHYQIDAANSDPHYRYGTGAWKIVGDQLLMYHSSSEYRVTTAADSNKNQCLITVNLESHSSPGSITFQYGTMNGDHADTTYGTNDGIVGISYGNGSVITRSSTITYNTDSGAVFYDNNCPVQVFPNQVNTIGTKVLDHKTIGFTRLDVAKIPFPAGNYFELTDRYFMKTKAELETSLIRLQEDERFHDYLYGPFDESYTTRITDMSNLFQNDATFDRDISHWDVSNVTNMAFMFSDASRFNQPLEQWNVSQVTGMYRMFDGAAAFNQPIGQWNVSQVRNMSRMFMDASRFNQDIGQWDTSAVTNMSYMFRGAADFNQPIGQWNVSEVTTMDQMFYGAADFNQPIGLWNVSQVASMEYMFRYAVSFKGAYPSNNIQYWPVQATTNLFFMFDGATALQAQLYPTTPGYDTDPNTPTYLFFNADNPCFDKSTTILAKKSGSEQERYIPIKELQKGDLVKTYKHGFKPIQFVGHSSRTFNNIGAKKEDEMYVMKKSGEMTHDLLLTGRHGLLLDDWSSHYNASSRNLKPHTYVEDKAVLGAGYTNKMKCVEDRKVYNVYHIAVAGDRPRYGIYANGGVLCESLDKNSMKKF